MRCHAAPSVLSRELPQPGFAFVIVQCLRQVYRPVISCNFIRNKAFMDQSRCLQWPEEDKIETVMLGGAAHWVLLMMVTLWLCQNHIRRQTPCGRAVLDLPPSKAIHTHISRQSCVVASHRCLTVGSHRCRRLSARNLQSTQSAWQGRRSSSRSRQTSRPCTRWQA